MKEGPVATTEAVIEQHAEWDELVKGGVIMDRRGGGELSMVYDYVSS